MDYQLLGQDICKAAKAAFTELAERSRPETLCAFALYSDESAMTVCPAANTSSHLTTAQADNPEFMADYKFSPSEWRFDGEGAEEAFAAISRQLAYRPESNEAGDEAAFDTFRSGVFEACANALKTLKAEGFFKMPASSPILLLFSVPDASITHREVALVKDLNDADIAREYERWARTFNEL